MGRLLNYGCGEIVDRLTVLSLKLLYGRESGKDVKHFEQERSALLTKLAGRTLNGAWFEQTLELAATNAALWQVGDALREIRSHDPNSGLMEEAGRLGCQLQSLNDGRALLIEAINKQTGDFIGPEKTK